MHFVTGSTACKGCYCACRWLDQQTAPSAKCLAGTYDSSLTPAILLQACQNGNIGDETTCTYDSCETYPVSPAHQTPTEPAILYSFQLRTDDMRAMLSNMKSSSFKAFVE